MNAADHQHAKSHVLQKIRDAHILTSPFPHFMIDQVFPEKYFDAMLEHIPDDSFYRKWTDVGKVKLEQYSKRDQGYLEDSWMEQLPAAQRTFWQDFAAWFLSDEFAQESMQVFADTLVKRFQSDRDGWPAVYPQAIFLQHRADYFIGPHTDIPSKVVNILFYLADNNDHEDLGTAIYEHESGLECEGNRHHEFDGFRKIKVAPYRRNSALGFVKTNNSWHGVEPIQETVAEKTRRNVIQYMVYDNPMRAPRKEHQDTKHDSKNHSG